MARPHYKSALSINKVPVPIDKSTVLLCHYDISTTDVNGIEPSSDTTTLTGMNQFIKSNGTAGYHGKYGGAVILGEATTNILLNPNIDHSSWNKQGVGSLTYHYNGPIDGQPVAHFTTTDSNPYFYCYTDMAPQLDSTIYTVSIWVRALESTLTIQCYTADNVEVGRYMSGFISVAPEDGWKRCVWTLPATAASCVQDSLSFHSTYTNGKYMELSSPQMEAKSFSTPYTNITRIASQLTYPLSSIGISEATDFTISYWALMKDEIISTRGRVMPLTVGEYYVANQSNICITSSISGDWNLSSRQFSIVVYSNLGAGGWSPPVQLTQSDCSGWAMFTLTYNSISKIATAYIYCDTGNKYKTSCVVTLTGLIGNIYVGGYSWTPNSWNSLVDELRVDNVERNEEEILSWYLSQCPFYAKERYKLVR